MLDVVKDQAGALHDKVGWRWRSGIRNEKVNNRMRKMSVIFIG
jgi:hypothetical protein